MGPFKFVDTQLFISWWKRDPQYCVSFVIENKTTHRALELFGTEIKLMLKTINCLSLLIIAVT
jgi:hypothetical protein